MITEHLKKYLGCEVIQANQTAQIPKYPYVSYTIITPLAMKKNMYCVDDNNHYNTATQTWSFTVQSDNDTESMVKAIKAHEWFNYVGRICLSDNNIVIASVGNVGNRDTLIDIDYEYRNGFDVTLRLSNVVNIADLEYIGTIEKVDI